MLLIILSVIIVLLLVVVIMQRVALISVRSARALRRKNIRSVKEAVDTVKPVNYLHDVDAQLDIGKHGEVVKAAKSVADTPASSAAAEDVDVILGLKADNETQVSMTTAADDVVPVTQSNEPGAVEPMDVPVESLAKNKLDVIVIHVQAHDGRPYSGYELLQSILSAGLRYGDMNIFHRYEKKTGRGGVKYSLSSAVDPGSFDLTNMGAFSSPALTLFLKPAAVKDPMQSFEEMLHTAGQLVDDLGGVVLDESQQPLTQAAVRDICLQIKSFQKSQQNMDLFEQI